VESHMTSFVFQESILMKNNCIVTYIITKLIQPLDSYLGVVNYDAMTIIIFLIRGIY
jgi:hypothetical protein